MPALRSICLMGAATGLAAGAVLHVALLLAGPEWIAFAGAPAAVVQSAEQGSWLAPAATLAITALLAALALCSIHAAGHVRPRRWIGIVLAAFALVFVIRGLIIVPALAANRVNWQAPADLFIVASSGAVLVIGVLLAAGLILAPVRSGQA